MAVPPSEQRFWDTVAKKELERDPRDRYLEDSDKYREEELQKIAQNFRSARRARGIATPKTAKYMVVYYPSDDRKRTYKISIALDSSNTNKCSCPSWIFSNPRKDCKHIRKALGLDELEVLDDEEIAEEVIPGPTNKTRKFDL